MTLQFNTVSNTIFGTKYFIKNKLEMLLTIDNCNFILSYNMKHILCMYFM